MAIQGPIGKENLDISFRLQSKSPFFDGSSNVLLSAKCNLIASASCHGIVFVGSSNPEVIVACLRDLESQQVEQNVPIRKVTLPSPASQIAVNCDGSILAVAVKLNGTPHIQLYSVASFLTPNIQKLREFRLSLDNADASQLCWNPVMSGTLAVCTESGALSTYTLKEAGIEYQSIDPNLKAKCCCWSPKGKQIVVGFGMGKLMQFTPELKPAKVIDCPNGIVAGTFDTIAIQWLSTFQFAVAYLSHQPESRPVLHIINAPKAGIPQYIAYNDVCYSSIESRPSKIYLQHITQWNMLLVSSANSIDVNFLRITQAGDLPVWTQEFPNDLFPAELPLTPNKDESFPIGFEIETGCSNRLLQEDGNPYPVMPMIHILSTYGVLSSFYVLNTTTTYIDICSPPRPLDPNALSLFKVDPAKSPPQAAFITPPKPDMPFNAPIGQSTPAIPKIQPMTTKPPPVANAFSSLGNMTQPAPLFGQSMGQSINPASAFQSIAKTTAPLIAPTQTQPATALITVPQTYTPAVTKHAEIAIKPQVVEKPNTAEDEQIYARMIQDEMKAFELELRTVMEKSRSLKVNIGTKDESAEMRRSIEELEELKKEATETIDSLRSDVQSNRLGLTEMFSMVYEARAKFDQAKNEKSIFMNQNQLQDRASKRTLDRLVKQVSQCEMQLQTSIQVMNAQWSSYQEAINKSKKNRMHNPSLEGLYQTLTKQQEIIYRQNEKMAMLKMKLGLRDNITKQRSAVKDPAMESFSDSMISISLADQVQNENSKLTNKKVKNLRNLLANRSVVNIKPQRPERAGLNSEIIREKKMMTIKTIKKRQLNEGPTNAPSIEHITSNVPRAILNPTATAGNQNMFASQQKPTIFGIGTNTAFGAAKKPDEMPKVVPFSGFGTSMTTPSFGLNLSTSTSQPSFGLSSVSLVHEAEKKKEENTAGQAPRLYINPVAHKIAADSSKIPSTISNTNVAVTASFSIPLAHKVSTNVPKEQPRVVEKKPEEVKPLTTNENTSFTFKISEKKDEPAALIKAPSATPNIASLLASSTDSSKGFSFGSGTTASPFSIETKTTDAKPPTTTAGPLIFSGFGTASAPSTTESPFGNAKSFSGFGSGFSLNLGDTAKPSFGLSLNLTSTTSEVTKPTASTGSFSFASLPSSTVVTALGETKPTTTSNTSVKPPTSASSFSFSGALQPSVTKPSEGAGAGSVASTFSFASLGSTIGNPSAVAPVDLTKTDSLTPQSSQSTLAPTSSSLSTQSSIDSILQGQTICSPDVAPKPVAQSPPANIFGSTLGSAAKTDSSSIFGGSAFGSAMGTASTTQATAFGSQTTSAQVASTLAAPVATTTTTSTSIFGAQNATTKASPSIFGALSLSSSDANNTSSTSPPSGLFSSLVKPDQSVFSQSSPTTATPTGTSSFGSSIFSSTGNQTSSVFGSQPANASPGSNIFGATTTQPSTGGIFGSAQTATTQASVFGAQQGSMFGQSGATGGSLFSQSSFATPATTPSGSIFGGAQTQAASPFGAASVFGSSQSPPQQQSSTGSIFGGQSTFGGAQASSGSIFGGSSAISGSSAFGSASVFGGQASFSNNFGGVGQSGFGSSTSPGASVFNQQAPAFGATPTFGGQATFGSPKSNIFGQANTGQSNSLFEQLGSQQSGNLFGNLAQNTQQPQPPPQQGPGFSGSAFSNWR